jgi:hypothetical protein
MVVIHAERLNMPSLWLRRMGSSHSYATTDAGEIPVSMMGTVVGAAPGALECHVSGEDNHTFRTDKDVVRAVAPWGISIYICHRGNTYLVSTPLDA